MNKKERRIGFLSDLFCVNYSGKCVQLQPMKINRIAFSLSGQPDTLIAVGGS